MNDTHGVEGEAWYGFDLDGTLAQYDGWKGIDHIGMPVYPIANMLRRMHESGKKVKIVTARVAPRENPETKPNPWWVEHLTIESPDKTPWRMEKDTYTALEFIKDWCWTWLHFVPEITHQKDHLMVWMLDDRTVQIKPNTGLVVGKMPKELSVYYWPTVEVQEPK